MKPVFFIVCMFCLFFGCKSSDQLVKRQTIGEKIESKNYTISFNKADPLREKNVSLTSGYTLTIENDSIYSLLPFFGKASYTSSTDRNEIRFREPHINYQLRSAKKDNYEIRFNVKRADYQYEFLLWVYDNDKCALTVNSPQRESITYYGKINR